VKDHVVLCEGPSRINAHIITLSGIRGTLNECVIIILCDWNLLLSFFISEILTFRSTIHPSSKLFQDLFNPATKASTPCLLPPLPTSLPDMTPPDYPQFIVPSYAASLVLPPRSQSATKPPLPPRHNNRTNTAANNVAAPSRLTNTFAALFGGSKSSNPPVSASPPASLHSLDSGGQDSHAAPIEVSAFTIDRRIVRKEIGREMNKILKAELKVALNASSASLGNVPMPSWIVERVQDVTAAWYPFVRTPSGSPLKKKLASEKETSSIGYFVNPVAENPDDAAERLQDFYLCLAQDMRVGGIIPFSSKRREKDESDGEDEQERDKREHEMMEIETRVRDVMEVVERTITTLFYDRFVPFSFLAVRPNSFSMELLIFQYTDYSCSPRPMIHLTMRHCQIGLQRLICWIWVLGILVLK
jgi:hypothetical protein